MKNIKTLVLETIGFTSYTSKPNKVQALQLSEHTLQNIITAIETIGMKGLEINNKGLLVKTLEGDMQANLGDYLVVGIKGEYYPCKADIFEKNHVMVFGRSDFTQS